MMSYEEENDEIMMMLSSAGNRMAYSQPQPISSKHSRVSTDSGYDSMLSSHSTSFTSSRSSIESSGDISSSLVSTTSSISPLLLSTTPVKKVRLPIFIRVLFAFFNLFNIPETQWDTDKIEYSNSRYELVVSGFNPLSTIAISISG